MPSLKRWTPSVGFIALALLGACSSLRVDTDHYALANFSRYKSYAWAPQAVPPSGSNPITQNTLLETRVKTAVNSQMAAKGIREVSPGESPDLQVYFHLSTFNEITAVGGGIGGYYYGAYPWAMGGYWGPAQVYQDQKGVLVLDFVDPKSGILVWRGVASQNIDQTGPSADQINKQVREMLAQYPPPGWGPAA